MAAVAADMLSRIDTLLEIIPAGILLLIGVPAMLFGADWLIRGSVAIARRLGVSTLIIGLTVVSAGTSAPELAINLIAALSGNTGISFGNVIGSNIANIGLIIGIGAILTPMVVHSRILRIELPWLMVISIGMVGLALIPMRLFGLGPGGDDESAAESVFGFGKIDGAIMLAGFIAVTWMWYRSCREDSDDPLTREVVEQADSAKSMNLAAAWGLFALGLVLLLLGGKLTEVGAVRTAGYFDLTHAVVGMSIVAVSTSLPELVTVIIACRRGYSDLAIGNIVGSNIFNILLVLGVTTVIADVPVPPEAGWQDLLAMVLLTAGFWWLAARGRPEVSRRAGVILLLAYMLYIGWSVLREAAGGC